MNLELNSGQRTRLTVVLAGLERDLFKLEKAFSEQVPQLELTKFIEQIPRTEPETLKTEVAKIRKEIAELSDIFQLQPMSESIRRNLLASFEVNYINVIECFPEHGLRNYGEVDHSSAEILSKKLTTIKDGLLRVIELVKNINCANERS